MKHRCLLSTVDRLPTINEMHESDPEIGDLHCSSHTMEEYVDSIKELSQPARYPLHGPLRGHRRWMVRACPGVTPVAPSVFSNSSRTYTPWIPVDLSDVSFTLTDQSNCNSSLRFNQNLLDSLIAESLFAGLVWATGRINGVNRLLSLLDLLSSLQRALTSAPCRMIHLCVRSNWVQPLSRSDMHSLWSAKWVQHMKQKMKSKKYQGQNKQTSRVRPGREQTEWFGGPSATMGPQTN